MKFVKGLLLGSAAGLIAAAGAQAADLPTRKAAPVDYVRICAVHGPGFFYIPGSDTCIKIGGRARFEYVYQQTYDKGTSPSSMMAQGRIAVDARTQTDFGLLRAYFRFELERRTGSFFYSGTAQREGRGINFVTASTPGFPSFGGQDTLGVAQTVVNISSAFVQWGGLTAGRLQSFFDFYADNDTWFGITDSDQLTTLLAYTYTFGSGFSATLSIEDPKARQFFPIAGIAPVGAGGINPTTATAPFTVTYPFAFSPFSTPAFAAIPGFGGGSVLGTINYAQRTNVPDVVGALLVDQGWGQAQLSAAYHRIETEGSTIVNFTPNNTATGFVVNPLVGAVSGGYGVKTGNGWAVQGGVKINLPMLAAGDYVYLQAAYSKGSISYANSGWPGGYSAGAYASAYDPFFAYDAVITPSGQLKLTPAYSGMVSLEHYWTPTIRQGLFAGAARHSYSSAVRTAAGFAAGAACPTCLGSVTLAGGAIYNPFSTQYNGGTQFTAGSNLIWSPVKDLDIGVEVFYARDEFQHKAWDQNRGNGFLQKSADIWLSRLRISRDF